LIFFSIADALTEYIYPLRHLGFQEREIFYQKYKPTQRTAG
jgi:hypothetical protein